MKNNICFLSIDVEKNIERLADFLALFKKYRLPATLFVTGEILEKHKEEAKAWSEDFEIACHSYSHVFWSNLFLPERRRDLEKFISLYQSIFNRRPLGFRAPSHIIDKEGFELLEEEGFLYDSSVVPHYPPFKKYRGYRGKAPLTPYFVGPKKKVLEMPVSGQLLGIPLAGAWINKLPFFVYRVLFKLNNPSFITLSTHSWNSLKNMENLLKLLLEKNYQFLNGREIYENYK